MPMVRTLPSVRQVSAMLGLVILASVTALSQTLNIDLSNGTTQKVVVKMNKSIGAGPAQAGPTTQSQTGSLAFYTANYTSLGGKQVPMSIVGTDPALGANT